MEEYQQITAHPVQINEKITLQPTSSAKDNETAHFACKIKRKYQIPLRYP
jgi:hypothetical protein